MKKHDESVQEILKGLEGLETLNKWELSLAQDLRGKAETLLRSLRGDGPPPDCPPAPSA